MAGDWLKIETVTPDKPEILEMAYELNLDPDAVFGKLFRVWTWFDSHSEKGNAPSVTEMLLDRQVGVSGFVSAMINVGWMQKNDEGLSIPNFETHNGATAKKRANTARRVAKHKTSNANTNEKDNKKVTPEALPKALAREEKRREESKDIKDKPKPDAQVLKFDSLKLSSDQLEEFKKHRKSKRGKLTERVINAFSVEFEKARQAGFTNDQILNSIVVRNWMGFEAQWMINARDSNSIASVNNSSSYTSTRDITIEQQVNDRSWAL